MGTAENGNLISNAETLQMVKEAGLRYTRDTIPGFSRIRIGEKYDYYKADGTKIEDEKVITRINKLIIPHIWENVWICPSEKGHLQATGFDKKNRKQYRYHKEWDKLRNERKFGKMLEFGQILPNVREIISNNLNLRKLTKEKVLSTVITIMDENLVRIGNKEYAKSNKTYGLSTLKDKHVKSLGGKLSLEFVGKKNIEKKVIISDRKLAGIIRKCKDIPGQDLFQYYDEDNIPHPIGSEDINSFLKEISGADISAKDFRTWGGSTIAIQAFLECEPCTDEKTLKKNIVDTIKKVSGCLGNTPSVCKGYYIHPIVIEKYTAKEIVDFAKKKESLKDSKWLSKEEKLFIELLKNAS